MVKHTKLLLGLFLGGVCAQLSCHSLIFNKPSSTANTPSIINHQADTVTIEIFTIRLAPYQNDLLQQLWREVDEQSLPPQLRRELLAQGFRVGVLGNLLSPALAQLLKVSSEGKSEIPMGNLQEFSAADVAHEATVTRNARNLLPEMRALVKIFDDHNALPELALFRRENGMLEGQTYTEAVGVLCISASVNKDGSAHIQIIPELEHGTLERRIRTVAGIVVKEESRPRHSFESLTISQRLLPGQWIILGATTLDSAGAGKAFFVRKTSVLEQRLLAIRLVHATPAAVSAPAPSLPTIPSGAEPVIPERN
jgi:hypothetical protein